MMRRVRWLAAGAVLGAIGYQRLQRAARSLTTEVDRTSAAKPSAARQAASVAGVAASAAGHAAGAAGWLARQVRSRRASGRRPGGVAGFVGDVRAGMDEYLDGHGAIETQGRRAQGEYESAVSPLRPYPRSSARTWPGA